MQLLFVFVTALFVALSCSQTAYIQTEDSFAKRVTWEDSAAAREEGDQDSFAERTFFGNSDLDVNRFRKSRFSRTDSFRQRGRFRNWIRRVGQKIKGFFKKAGTWIRDIAVTGWSRFVQFARNIGSWVKSELGKLWTKIRNFVMRALRWLVNKVVGGITTRVACYASRAKAFVDKVKSLASSFKSALESIRNAAKNNQSSRTGSNQIRSLVNRQDVQEAMQKTGATAGQTRSVTSSSSTSQVNGFRGERKTTEQIAKESYSGRPRATTSDRTTDSGDPCDSLWKPRILFVELAVGGSYVVGAEYVYGFALQFNTGSGDPLFRVYSSVAVSAGLQGGASVGLSVGLSSLELDGTFEGVGIATGISFATPYGGLHGGLEWAVTQYWPPKIQFGNVFFGINGGLEFEASIGLGWTEVWGNGAGIARRKRDLFKRDFTQDRVRRLEAAQFEESV